MMIDFFRFVLCRLNKKFLVKFFLVGILTLFLNLITLITPLLQKKVIDSINISIFDSKSIILLLVIGLLGSIFLINEALILNSLVVFLKNMLQCELLSSVIRKKNKIIEEKGSGAYMVNIFGDSDQISSLLGSNYFSIIANCITTLIILIISIKWSWIFIGIVVPTYILMIWILFVSNKKYIKMFEKGRNVVLKLNPKVLEFIENRQTILAYANIKKYEEDLNDIMNFRDSYFKKAFAANVFGKTAIDALRNASMIIFFILSMVEILNHKMELSAFIALITYFSRIFSPIFSIQDFLSGMNRFKMLKNKINDSLDVPPNLSLPNNQEIFFNNCSFSYNNNTNSLKNIKDFSLTIDKKIGLVGLSGEGKTTILKILLGELETTYGQCLYGDKNVLAVSKFITNSNIRLYSQEPEIFDNSLEFNITLNKIKLSKTDYNKKELELRETIYNCFTALEAWGISKENLNLTDDEYDILKDIFLLTNNQLKSHTILKEIAENIPENLDEIIKNLASILVARRYYIKERYEKLLEDLSISYLEDRDLGQRGSRVSGGEKNKICLARFLLSAHQGYFIIDEPFTSLDLLSEKNCMEVLKENIALSKGIIISHRLNIIKELSDEIIILENGEISKQGSHDYLIKNSPLYAELFKEYLGKREVNG